MKKGFLRGVSTLVLTSILTANLVYGDAEVKDKGMVDNQGETLDEGKDTIKEAEEVIGSEQEIILEDIQEEQESIQEEHEEQEVIEDENSNIIGGNIEASGKEYLQSEEYLNTYNEVEAVNNQVEAFRVNNYINGDSIVRAGNHIYTIDNGKLLRFNLDLTGKEEIEGRTGVRRVYETNGQVYYSVNDGIKRLNYTGVDDYIYQAEGFKSKYCQLINDKFYFFEYGTYIEWTLGTDTIIKPSDVTTNALRSVGINGGEAKIYYYNDLKMVDEDGIYVPNVERKVISGGDDDRFIIAGNNAYIKNKIYDLILMDEDTSFIEILSGINFSTVMGYDNDRFYCNKNRDLYELSFRGNATLIKKEIDPVSAFQFNGKTYINGYHGNVYHVSGDTLNEIGFISGVKKVYQISNELYSTDKYFHLMKLNLKGNNPSNLTNEDILNINNNYYVNRINFTFDEKHIYKSDGRSILWMSKDLKEQGDFGLSSDLKGNIRSFSGGILYNSGEAIKVIGNNEKVETLYNSPYKVHKIELIGNHVYFSETSTYATRLGRVNILNKEVEFLINHIGWNNGDGNSNYVAKSFLVHHDKIYYNYHDGSGVYTVFAYDINTGLSTIVEGLRDIGEIIEIDSNTLYIKNNKKLFTLNPSTGEKIEWFEAKEDFNMFNYNGNKYILTFSKYLMKFDKGLIGLGYLNSRLNVLFDGYNLYKEVSGEIQPIDVFVHKATTTNIEGGGIPGRKIEVRGGGKEVGAGIIGKDNKFDINLSGVKAGEIISIRIADEKGKYTGAIDIEVKEGIPDFELEDLDKNGVVDSKDLDLLKALYNVKSNDEKWNPDFDLNDDGIIDLYDLVLVSKKIT